MNQISSKFPTFVGFSIQHEVPDQWLLVQGTEVQNKCTGKENMEKLFEICTSRDHRVTLQISYNIVCKFVFAGFVHNVKSTFCTVS